MAWTNVGKVKELLRNEAREANVKFDVDEMAKGSAKDFTLDEEQVKNIIKGEKNNALEVLNKVGELLKKSWLTRSTGHKELDFASVQTTSEVNFTRYCYQKMPNVKIPDRISDVVSEEMIDEINIKVTKIWRDLYKSTKAIENEKAFKEIINKELKKPANDRKRDFSEAIKILHDDYHFDENKIILPERIRQLKKIRKKNISDQLRSGGAMGEAINYFATMSEGTPLSSAARSLGLSFGTGVLVHCGVSALILHFAGKNIIETREKQALIKLQEGLTRVIKQINDLNKYVLDNIEKNSANSAQEASITDEHKNLLKTFLEEQKKIWEPYTMVSGRAYHEATDKGNLEKHWSLGKRVSNKKTSAIGKMKLGLAKQWCKIKLDDSLLK